MEFNTKIKVKELNHDMLFCRGNAICMVNAVGKQFLKSENKKSASQGFSNLKELGKKYVNSFLPSSFKSWRAFLISIIFYFNQVVFCPGCVL